LSSKTFNVLVAEEVAEVFPELAVRNANAERRELRDALEAHPSRHRASDSDAKVSEAAGFELARGARSAPRACLKTARAEDRTE